MVDLNPTLRLLVACTGCHRQYDASQLAVGARFHCTCGTVIVVPEPRPHDAKVVRCSSCGAPRQGLRERCRYCDSDFTLHEQDLHTLCPECATRISNRARYCHSCATPITPQQVAGETTEHRCPNCREGQQLASRPLGGEKLSILECDRCAGIWLGHEVFDLLQSKAKDKAPVWRPAGTEAGKVDTTTPSPPGQSVVYRPCPLCTKLMNRSNYGIRSGIIIDACAQHGIWFDDGELQRILQWIGDGKAEEAQRRHAEFEKIETARRTTSGPMPPLTQPVSTTAGSLGGFIALLLDFLLDR